MYKSIYKRLLDFLIALVVLVILSPVILLVFILLHFANKGAGVFFKQSRPGKTKRYSRLLSSKPGMMSGMVCFILFAVKEQKYDILFVCKKQFLSLQSVR